MANAKQPTRKTESPAPKKQSALPQSKLRNNPSPEEVYRAIQETAYYKAKARGFAPGREVQDWIEAEAEVRKRIGSQP